MKILLLEDDDALSRNITAMLEESACKVVCCKSGQDAIFFASSEDYDVLVFDRLVEGMDGLRALKALRGIGVRTPAIFLTAMTGVEDRVEGLEAGADDYLAKPFSERELLARLQALSRRAPNAEAPSVVTVGDFQIDRLKRLVSRAGHPIRVQVQEFKLLEYLMLNAGQVVTRAMILESVWSYHFEIRTNIIESHMSRLRAKLCANGGSDPIHTFRGIGYRFHDG
ncbi:MAG: response regulator transcription factor [Sphingomonadales bacterium]|nr:response regulator transcription factor [Sphingomonadales bacterium]MDE2171582.1 response regulator transcription factor [Sphingomonadales bacterium]